MMTLIVKCELCGKEFKADSEELYWHLKIHQAKTDLQIPQVNPSGTIKQEE